MHLLGQTVIEGGMTSNVVKRVHGAKKVGNCWFIEAFVQYTSADFLTLDKCAK